MALVNINATLVNGVQEITGTNNVTANASAVKESLLFRNGASLRASAPNTTVSFIDCNVTLNGNAATSTRGNTQAAVLSYAGNFNHRNPPDQDFVVLRTNVFQIKPLSTRFDYFFSEVKDSTFVVQRASGESSGADGVFVYTKPGAVLNNVRFTGVAAWEIVGPPSQAFGVQVRECDSGYLNWEAGRLDFYYFQAIDCIVDAWQFSGPNHHWNNVNFDTAKIRSLNSPSPPNGDTFNYREGYTASWRFLNPDLTPASGVNLILRDDFATAGNVVEVGRWTTNAQGRLSGTVDSRTRTTGSDQERAALFLQTGHGFFNSSGLLRSVSPRIEIRSYNHQPVDGFGPSDTFAISAPIGSVNALGVAEIFEPVVLALDFRVTATQAVALAYADLDTPDKFYDRLKAEWATVDGRPAPEASGDDISLGSVNLVIDATAVSAYSFASNTITVKASAINGTGRIVTTGTITFVNGAVQGTTMLQGSNYVTPVMATGSITNIVTGSRLQVFNETTNTEVFNGIISGTGYSNTYVEGTTFTAGDIVRVRLAWHSGAVAKLPVQYRTLATANGWSILADQVDDTVYIQNAIDGDTVTEFIEDFPNVEIDIDDPDGVTTVQRGYAWYIAGQMTADGIRFFHGGMVAEDDVNYRINVNVVDMRIQNINPLPVLVIGGRLYRSDGSTVIRPGGGGVQMEYGRAYAVETGVSGLTPAESDRLMQSALQTTAADAARNAALAAALSA